MDKVINAITILVKNQLKNNCIKIVRYLANNPIKEESIILLSNDLMLSKIEIQTVNIRDKKDIRIIPLEYHYTRYYPSESWDVIMERIISRYCEFFSMIYNLNIKKKDIKSIVSSLREF